MGDIGYSGRGCVTLLSLESEKGKEKEVMTDAQTDGQMDRISTCRLDHKRSSKNIPLGFLV